MVMRTGAGLSVLEGAGPVAFAEPKAGPGRRLPWTWIPASSLVWLGEASPDRSKGPHAPGCWPRGSREAPGITGSETAICPEWDLRGLAASLAASSSVNGVSSGE